MVLAIHVDKDSSPGCPTSTPEPCWRPEKPAEDGPGLWTHVRRREYDGGALRLGVSFLSPCEALGRNSCFPAFDQLTSGHCDYVGNSQWMEDLSQWHGLSIKITKTFFPLKLEYGLDLSYKSGTLCLTPLSGTQVLEPPLAALPGSWSAEAWLGIMTPMGAVDTPRGN